MVPGIKTRNWLRDVLLASGATSLAIGLSFTLGHELMARVPLVPYLLAVLLAGSVSARAGFVTIALSASALATALPPVGVPFIIGRPDRIIFFMFLGTSSCIGLICAVMHRGRQRTLRQANALLSAEHSAQVLNRKFQIALDASMMVTWDWDLTENSITRSENAVQMFGLGDHSADAFFELVALEDRPRLESAIQNAKENETGYEFTYRARRLDGSMRWLADRARFVIDPVSGHRHLTGASVDITERIQLEEQLRAEHKQKDIFLATLAHELRNPLAPLSNGLEVLKRTMPMADSNGATMAIMERQLAHVGRLIDDLLDVSRVARGKIDLERRRVPLNRVLETAIETVQPILNRVGQKIELAGVATAEEIDGDFVRLAQVFSNLLDNASRFSPRGATIEICARRVGNMVEVSVVDTGAGIPPEHLDHILELFWQVPEAEGGMPRGLGIGLTLSNTLLSLHGGSLTMSSEGLGRGTTATVGLPCALTTAATLDVSAASKPLEALPARKFLVVDDNVDAALSLVNLLRMGGHSADAAHSGSDALQRVAQAPPDIVILDIGMPDMDGLEVCKRLRQTETGANMLIVALTGWGDAEYRQRSQEAGFNAHFVKPLSGQDLARLLEMQTPPAASPGQPVEWSTIPLATVTVSVQTGETKVGDAGRELQ